MLVIAICAKYYLLMRNLGHEVHGEAGNAVPRAIASLVAQLTSKKLTYFKGFIEVLPKSSRWFSQALSWLTFC